MNRAEKRREGRRGKTPTYNMNQDQVAAITKQTMEQELEQTKKDAIQYAVNSTIAIFMVTLNKEFGFAHTRLKRVLKSFNNTFDCVNAGTVDVEDFIEHCSSEFGINFDIKMK